MKGSILFAGAAALALLAPHANSQESWVIRAETIHTAAGDPIENGSVVVSDGKIQAVGGGGGGGGEILEAAAVTPGLIDLSVRIDMRDYSVEQSTETAVQYRVTDGLDLFSYRWDRELKGGVTTVLATPYDLDVIGGLGAVLKTGGALNVEERLLAQDAVLRGSVGPQASNGNRAPRGVPPINFYFRRPTTRMGVEWVFRKAYYDVLNGEKFGGVPEEDREAYGILKRTLRGELPLFVQAKATQDVRTSIYLKEEFGIPNMVLDNAIEAWKEPELVRRSGVGVILPPFPAGGRVPDGFVNDTYFMPLDAAAKLKALGVRIALSGHGAQDVAERLARQAGFAMRGGLSPADALAAVTIEPARMVGVDDRVGSIEVGKDADLVLWSGPPFEPTSGIIGVILSGELVVDPRASD